MERIKRPGDSVPWRFFLYKSSGLTGKTKTPLTIRNNWILAYEYSRIVNTAPIKRHDQYFLISFFSYQWHVYLFWPFPEECFRFNPNPDGLFEIVRWWAVRPASIISGPWIGRNVKFCRAHICNISRLYSKFQLKEFKFGTVRIFSRQIKF